MSKRTISSPEVIFYSDEENDEFQVEKNQMCFKQNDIEKYIDEILNPPFEIDKKVYQKHSSTSMSSPKRQIQTAIEESPKDFSSFQDQEESDSDNSSQFSLNGNEKGGKGSKIGIKMRASNQNICKKYHTLANRCLRKVQIYKYLSPYIKHVHKRNYFIFVLITCQKTGKLAQFAKLYRQSATSMLSKCQQAMKDAFHGSKKYKENKQFSEAIRQSLEALTAYERGQVYESLKILFDVEKMKRISWLQIAYEEVLTFGDNFPTK